MDEQYLTCFFKFDKSQIQHVGMVRSEEGSTNGLANQYGCSEIGVGIHTKPGAGIALYGSDGADFFVWLDPTQARALAALLNVAADEELKQPNIRRPASSAPQGIPAAASQTPASAASEAESASQ